MKDDSFQIEKQPSEKQVTQKQLERQHRKDSLNGIRADGQHLSPLLKTYAHSTEIAETFLSLVPKPELGNKIESPVGYSANESSTRANAAYVPASNSTNLTASEAGLLIRNRRVSSTEFSAARSTGKL